MQVQLDGSTKIVMADRIKFEQGDGTEPLDYAKDRIVIVDPATFRPIAMIRPVVEPAPAPKPKPEPEEASEKAHAEPNGDAGPKHGPLTEAQSEGLTRLVRSSRTASPETIAGQFERMFGRSVSVVTVNKYRGQVGAK